MRSYMELTMLTRIYPLCEYSHFWFHKLVLKYLITLQIKHRRFCSDAFKAKMLLRHQTLYRVFVCLSVSKYQNNR